MTRPADWAKIISRLDRSRPAQGIVRPRYTIRAVSASWLNPRTPRLALGGADPELLAPTETAPARFASPMIEHQSP